MSVTPLILHRCPTVQIFVRDASVVTPYALLLFGGPLTVHHRDGKVTVGGSGWVSLHAEARVGVLAKALRAALSRLLAEKIQAPHSDISGSAVIEAILRLLINNGM